VFDRPDFAWAAKGLAPEVLWLLGTEGLQRFDALRPAAPPGPASRVFPAGGYAVNPAQVAMAFECLESGILE